MSRLIAAERDRPARGAQARIAFEHVTHPQSPMVTRFLTIEGRHAFELGIYCDTCSFWFTRLEGANTRCSIGALHDRLQSGLTRLDADVVDAVGDAVPAGDYDRLLLECTPRLVRPHDADDYFRREQVDLWGVDRFWDLPHDPRTPYYRLGEADLGAGARLYELLVPLVPPRWVRDQVLEDYKGVLQSGVRPTAVTLSFLDVKQPALWENLPAVSCHYVLCHLLIDGHHKTLAAAETGRPLTLLSLLSHDGAHKPEQRASMMDHLAAASA
jgi:hypothetical protein